MTRPKVSKEIWVADCETDPFRFGVIPKPFIWGVYNGTKYWEFLGTGKDFYCTDKDHRKLINFLKKRDIIIYAHNGGKFDWHFLTKFMEVDQEMLIINGRLSKFSIGKCEFRDSFNLIPVGLNQWNKTKFDYTKMHYSERANHLPEIKSYLKDDCTDLYNMLTEFQKEYGMHISQASAAMSIWRNKSGEKIPRTGALFYDTFEPFYFGGRVQCFKYGDIKKPALSIDINSAYPFAMKSQHPYSTHYDIRTGKPLHDFKNWGPIFFTIECVARGCFPYRTTTGALYYPADDVARIYYVTGYELQAAIETKTIDDLLFIEHYVFEETTDFGEYVDYFYERRLQAKADGDKGKDLFAKLFLNSLYGKFCADPRKYKTHVLKHTSQLESILSELEDGETFKHFHEWIIVSTPNELGEYTKFFNLATGASITGFVRAMLWRKIQEAKGVVYCDTDSITAEAFPGTKFTKVLGDWDLEFYYNRVVVCGKKMYAYRKAGKLKRNESRWKKASKGAVLTYQQIIKMAKGELVFFNNDAPTFSASKAEPTFVSRELQMTATDITSVPRSIDPLFADEIDKQVTETDSK